MLTESGGAAVFEITQDPCGWGSQLMAGAIGWAEAAKDFCEVELRTRLGVRVHQERMCAAMASRGDLVFAMVAVLTWT